MSDSDFVDVGDELVVRIGGYPVGKAIVYAVDEVVRCEIFQEGGIISASFTLPLNFKDYDIVDGYGHGSQPLRGTVG